MLWPGVTGGRNATTIKRLYEKVKHLEICTFYTDDWDAFAKVLPKNHHMIGKAHITTIEKDNRNTRHHLERMTRRMKVVSKKEEMIECFNKVMACLHRTIDFQNLSENFLIYFYAHCPAI